MVETVIALLMFVNHEIKNIEFNHLCQNVERKAGESERQLKLKKVLFNINALGQRANTEIIQGEKSIKSLILE